MFGVPAAFFVDDENRRREAASRRASLASNANSARASGPDSLPPSRVASRATSRKPSLSGIEEREDGDAPPPRAVSLMDTNTDDRYSSLLAFLSLGRRKTSWI